MMMRHLLWKDVMSIKPLLAAILIAIITMNAILILVTATLNATDSSTAFVLFWILMPNLVALGAPALLVGGEEECGTLTWLRSLPVRWQNVADSKFLIALGGVALAWLAASLMLLLGSSVAFRGVELSQSGLNFGLGASQPDAFVENSLGILGVSYLLFFSLLLLLCGFVTAYLFRSPVSGLIAVVPLILSTNWLATSVGDYLLTGHRNHPAPALDASSLGRYVAVAFCGAGLLMVIWVTQRALACRRLTSPQANRMRKLGSQDSSSAYRPPAAVGTARPRQSRALLWQQRRQIVWPATALTFLVGFFIVAAAVNVSGGLLGLAHEIAVLPILIGTSWLGGLAFYGDNVRGRWSFFADRGVSSTSIWWTRLLIPLICFSLLLGIQAIVQIPDYRGKGILIAMVVSFFVGMMIGQWMSRPVLTFLAGPACATIVLVALFPLYDLYPAHHWTLWFAAPVFLFASWRLTSRWIVGRVDYEYHWRAVASLVAAIMVPVIAVVAQRVATTPESMPSWRASMIAMDLPEPRTYSNGRPIHSNNIDPGTFSRAGVSTTFSQASPAEQLELLNDELDSERIGDFVSLADLDVVLRSSSRELRILTIQVLLKWARKVRVGATDGEYTLWDLATVAEASEERAVAALEQLTLRGTTPELAALVRGIPDQQLRKESRRAALINDWKTYQSMDWDIETHGFKEFAHEPVGLHVSRFPFERTRANRYIDELTHLLLQQLELGLPARDSAEFRERDHLWSEAITTLAPQMIRPMEVCRNWTRQYEQRIESLRSRIALHLSR